MWSLLGAKLRFTTPQAFRAPRARRCWLSSFFSPFLPHKATRLRATRRTRAKPATQINPTITPASLPMPLAALLKPCVFGGRLPRAVIRALPSGWGSYDLGEGVGQDAAAAYVWYRTAAEAGVGPAEFNIAVMCDSGVGTARNAAEAAVWYARAAAHGIARANTIWRNYMRPETACRAISTWQKHGMPRQRLTRLLRSVE